MVAHRERNRLQRQLPRLDLREIEDVVEHDQQRVGRRLDHRQVVALLGRQVGVEGEIGHADDAVHRRADFVAHVGQELALGAVGLLGGQCRLGELRGALAHFPIEIGGQIAQVVIQLLALLERLLDLMIRVGEARLHAVDVVDERREFRRRVRNGRRLRRRLGRRNIADEGDQLLERARHGVAERSGDQHRAAERQRNQRERHHIVAVRLQPHAEARLRDEHLPAGDRNRADADDLDREGPVAGLRRVLVDTVRRAPAGAHQFVVGQILLRLVRRSVAGVDRPVVLIEDDDGRVGDGLVLFDELAEFRQVEVPKARPPARRPGRASGAATKTIGTGRSGP